ncbi:MAG: T9SS type A sorting domain-containing protein [Bacteroidales bacterium]|nr:T9SS type A sorting domain-containing protein [Bacteroidales bacterium]MCF8455805.1 T9SS type A sorting domain-containing protein [Bacteroidales bacterium]
MNRIVLVLTCLFVSAVGFAQKSDVLLNPDIIPIIFHGETQPLGSYVEDPNAVNELTRTEKIGYHPKSDWVLNETVNPNALPQGWDPIHQKEYVKGSNKELVENFSGMGYTSVNPADPCVDVGPNHVVQMINGGSGSYIKVWNKTGTSLMSQVYFDNFMGMPGGAGDPIVVYDEIADRWLLSEFSNSGNNMHVAISTTANPTGTYYTYSFNAPYFPDYPKYSVWKDSYIITTNENTSAVYALNRTNMLAGTPATAQRFTMSSFGTISFQAATPVSLNGTTLPPTGTPAMVMRMRDDAWSGSATDALELWEFNVNWTTPSLTSLTLSTVLGIAPYESELCGYTSFSCIDQPGSSTNLDPLREVLMNRIHYRNFGTHESIVCCHVADVNGTDWAGMRWYELRRTGGTSGSWTIYQQGNYAPDSNDRWMGAIAISASGNIGLAYNVAGSSTYPSLRYTGRKSCDPLGVMTEPETLIASGSSPNASNRYGDYNAMVVDPSDGETFWFTGMYNPATQWSTKIASFDLGSCAPMVQFASNAYSVNESDANVSNGCLDYFLVDVPISIAEDPTQAAAITIFVAGGTATQGIDFELLNTSFTFGGTTLSGTTQIKIYNDAYVENTETIELNYTLNANSGNAVAGTINQSVTITIADDDVAPASMSVTSTIFFHNFESGMAPFTTNNPAGATAWQVGNNAAAVSSAFTIPTSNTTQFAWINDDGCNCNQNNVDLYFPVIDLSSYTSGILTFDTYFEDNTYQSINENADLLVSISGGAYTLIGALVASVIDVSWVTQSFDISSYTGNSSVQFKINYSDGGGWLYGCTVDDVLITGEAAIGIQTAVNTVAGHTANLGPNETVHFLDPGTNNLMVSLTNTSLWDYGCVTVNVDRDGSNPTALPFTNNTLSDYLLSKTFTVTPYNPNPNGTYNITLYYEEAEVAAWENITGNSRNDAYIIKVSGNNSIADVTPANYLTYSIENSSPSIGSFFSGVTFTASFASGFSGFGVGLPPSTCSGFSISNVLVTNPSCGSNNGTIDITAIGGTAPIQYSIDNGLTFQASAIFTGLAAGSYSILVQDAATCQSTASEILNASTAGPIIQFGFDTIYTMQPETVVLVPGAFDSYLWSTGATSSVLFIDDYGTYSLTVTQNQCSDVDSVLIAEQQAIWLNQGWGIFSTYINTSLPIDDLFAQIFMDVVIVKDEDGNVYWQAFNFNNIGNHTVGESYLVRMQNGNWLIVKGDAVIPELTPINLTLNFNHLGYLRKTNGGVEAMMNSIVDKIAIMKDGDGDVYWPLYSLNQIGNMIPGKGYQIKLTADTVFTYPANSMATSKLDFIKPSPVYYQQTKNTGQNMTLGIPLEAWQEIPESGDEIAVFDLEGNIVGVGIFTGTHFAIPVWGKDELSANKEGLADNENFTLQLWHQSSGKTDFLFVEEWLEGDDTYNKDKISIAGKINHAVSDRVSITCFPNPFSHETTIQFTLPENGTVKIELYNSEGKLLQLIGDEEYRAGLHSLKLKMESYSPGSYFIRLVANGETVNQAVQVVR